MTTLQSNNSYRRGAVAGRNYLRRMQEDLRKNRHFEPKSLRWELLLKSHEESAAFEAGFLDAIGAYVQTTLEGVLVNVYRWDILQLLGAKDDKKETQE